ncbi:hypothetical protein D9M68_710800 [compost metagenome]
MTVRVAPSISVAMALRSARASWVFRDMPRRRRAKVITGNRIAGAAITTPSVRIGLVSSIMISAPMMVTIERRASEKLDPTAPRIIATSPLSRLVSSPTR